MICASMLQPQAAGYPLPQRWIVRFLSFTNLWIVKVNTTQWNLLISEIKLSPTLCEIKSNVWHVLLLLPRQSSQSNHTGYHRPLERCSLNITARVTRVVLHKRALDTTTEAANKTVLATCYKPCKLLSTNLSGRCQPNNNKWCRKSWQENVSADAGSQILAHRYWLTDAGSQIQVTGS